jgi:hypothetical protein
MGKVRIVEREDATLEDLESTFAILERHGFIESFVGDDGRTRWRKTDKPWSPGPADDDWVPPDDGLQS